MGGLGALIFCVLYILPHHNRAWGCPLAGRTRQYGVAPLCGAIVQDMQGTQGAFGVKTRARYHGGKVSQGKVSFNITRRRDGVNEDCREHLLQLLFGREETFYHAYKQALRVSTRGVRAITLKI